MYISAKVDYAVRALCTLASADERPVTAETLAQSQGLPAKFLESILNDMRRAGILLSQRGAEGGYRLSRPATAITVADVIRPLDGPLAEVRGLRPEAANYEGAAEHLQDVWIAVRASAPVGPRAGHHRRHRVRPTPPWGPETHQGPRRLAVALNPPGLTPAR